MTKHVERTIIKAEPGWAIARWIPAYDNHEGSIEEDPIIAWSIERSDEAYHPAAQRPDWDRLIRHAVEPITIEGDSNALSNDWCIKRPDGLYVQTDVIGPVDQATIIDHFKANEIPADALRS